MLVSWIIALALYAIIDIIWLTQIANSFMAAEMGTLLSDTPRLWAAGLFYLLHAAGLVFFVIEPYRQAGLFKLFLIGAFFGLLVYAAFDLTCLAVIKGWSLKLSIVDMLWGAGLNGVVALLSVRLLAYIQA